MENEKNEFAEMVDAVEDELERQDDEQSFSAEDEAKTELTKYNLEKVIAVGSSKSAVFVIFGKTHIEMDKWCKENFRGANFNEVYGYFLEKAKSEYLNTLKKLAGRGNATAMNLVSNFLMNYSENSDSGKVVIVNNIPPKRKDE